jgi:hypothetical protein
MSVLHLFPSSGFDRSTTTPVLIGVLISWLFTETLGWVFAGLVVPGYLAAVFALDPRAGAIDVGEAVLTYLVARGLGEHLSRTGLTSRVFGRERFLLIVITSILVRLGIEGVLLPRLAPHAAQSFFSIGLVVVPLAANACWKTALARGLVQNGVPTLLTWLLLRWVLLPHTNLSLAGFELATEDVAASFLSSPKAYFLLITGATLAAASNVLDGWDFNGILVPALLALVVMEPTRLVATFAEAAVLVLVVAVLLRTTRLGRANVEGPRRLVLFFAVDYALRFGFAALAGGRLGGHDAAALMGFGYLLPTLLAVKIAQRRSAALVLLPTAHVAVTAFALGTLLGFAATLVDARGHEAQAAIDRALPPPPRDVVQAALWAAALARPAPPDDPLTRPIPAGAVRARVEGYFLGHAASAASVEASLDAAALDGDAVLFRERFATLDERRGDPMVIATRTGASRARRLVLLVPSPLRTPALCAFGAAAVRDGHADALVIAGVESGTAPDAWQVRAARRAARALADDAGGRGVVLALAPAPDVTASTRLITPPGASRESRLAALCPADRCVRAEAPLAVDGATDGLLALREADAERALPLEPPAPSPSLASPPAIAEALAARALVANAAGPDTPEDELVLRRLVLAPLVEPTRGTDAPPRVAVIRAAAAMLGLELVGPIEVAGVGRGFALLPARSRGRSIALLVREGGVRARVLEVPHAGRASVRDAALALATRLAPDAVLLGLSPVAGGPGTTSFRTAHFASTHAAMGRSPSVVLLRGADPREAGALPSATLSVWGDDRDQETRRATERALSALELPSRVDVPDRAARELAGRALFDATPMVSVALTPSALRRLSLHEARGLARDLLDAGIVAHDGTPEALAIELARALPRGAAVAPVAWLSYALGAARDGSVRDLRALRASIDRTATRAALARGPEGDSLVVVARPFAGASSLEIDVIPIAPHAPMPLRERRPARDTASCADALRATLACRAEAP